MRTFTTVKLELKSEVSRSPVQNKTSEPLPKFAWPEGLVPWDTEEGIKRLAQSQYKKSFFKLAPHFQQQQNKFFCGVASMVTLLNALLLPSDQIPEKLELDQSSLPISDALFTPPNYNPYFKWFSQLNFFSLSNKSRKEVCGFPSKSGHTGSYGFQLMEMKNTLELIGLECLTLRAHSDFDYKHIKETLNSTFNEKNRFVIANFCRKTLGQDGNGHIAPIAAYDQVSDSYLVLDVNPFMSNWFWLNSSLLFKSISTLSNGEPRGLLIVKGPGHV